VISNPFSRGLGLTDARIPIEPAEGIKWLCHFPEGHKVARALQSCAERGGFGCLGCGGEDRLLVGFEDGKPGRGILRVIGAGIVCDVQIGAGRLIPTD
jgi:hypothetical protein